MYKRYLTSCLVGMLLLGAMASIIKADEPEEILGRWYDEMTGNLSFDVADGFLQDGAPTTYDLRNVGGTNYMTSVKNQGACGSCWAFASYGSLESSVLMEGGATLDFSENHLKNYHGFDWGPCAGGNTNISAAYLSRGSGPISESDDPYNPWDDRPSPGGTVQGYVREVDYFRNDTAIKNAVMTQGGLYTSMYWDSGSYNSTTYSHYYTGGTGTNHGVVIAGWDDNKATAGGTGAWLIKNSWGMTGSMDNGYFWLAYQDTAGGKYGASFNDFAANWNNNYHHDDYGHVTSLNSPYGFNAYTATQDETLSAVGFYTMQDNASYDIRIYDDYTGGSLSNLLSSITGTITIEGWHTVDLATLVTLTQGDDFYIYLNLTNGGSFPLACDRMYAGYNSNSTASANESFYSFDGTSWTDLTTWDSTANFSIKGFTIDLAPIPEPSTIFLLAMGFFGLAVYRRKK